MSETRLTLRVDPIACDAHGLCAELFPERVTLDDWGYPIVDGAPIPRGLERHARRAVAECPRCALQLVRSEQRARRTRRDHVLARGDDVHRERP